MKVKGWDTAAVVILLLAVALLTGWRWFNNPGKAPLAFEEPGPTLEDREAKPSLIKVHVAGAVQNPGVYTLPEKARALDALTAAGGPHPEADSHAYNLAQPLYDGQRIEIPFTREEGEGPGRELGPGGSPLININTASARDLETLPNIGPARAAQIVENRERYGYFTSVEDLTRVPGIGDKILASLKDLVTVF